MQNSGWLKMPGGNIWQSTPDSMHKKLPSSCLTDQEMLIVMAIIFGGSHLHLLGYPFFQVLCLSEILMPVHGGHQFLSQVCRQLLEILQLLVQHLYTRGALVTGPYSCHSGTSPISCTLRFYEIEQTATFFFHITISMPLLKFKCLKFKQLLNLHNFSSLSWQLPFIGNKD